MIGWRAFALLVVALMLQTLLGQLWPEVGRWLDLLLVPVAVAGAGASARGAMLVGCASGLLADAWFSLGSFGLNGFKRTLIGAGLAGLSTRVDLDHPGGRLAAGVLAVVADGALDLLLRALLDLGAAPGGVVPWLVRALTTGLLATISGTIVGRVGPTRDRRRL